MYFKKPFPNSHILFSLLFFSPVLLLHDDHTALILCFEKNKIHYKMLIHQAGVWIKNKWIPPLLTGVRHRFHETWIKHYIPEKILLSWVENDCLIWRGGQENGKAWTDKHTPFTDAKKRRTPLTNMPQLWCTEVASCLKAVRWTWQRPWILVFAENQAADRGTGCMLWQLSQHQNFHPHELITSRIPII